MLNVLSASSLTPIVVGMDEIPLKSFGTETYVLFLIMSSSITHKTKCFLKLGFLQRKLSSIGLYSLHGGQVSLVNTTISVFRGTALAHAIRSSLDLTFWREDNAGLPWLCMCIEEKAKIKLNRRTVACAIIWNCF